MVVYNVEVDDGTIANAATFSAVDGGKFDSYADGGC